MDKIIGTCSECGGAVTLPRTWMGMTPPNPTCRDCGAVRVDHGPVIQMKPRGEQPTPRRGRRKGFELKALSEFR